jgi:hypothetical protein
VKRNTEYCQWQEVSQDNKRTWRDSDGNEQEEIIRTYSYYKTWSSSRIPSLLFDQPAAHYNPQRDPVPSGSMVAEKVRFGDFTVHSEVIQNSGPLKSLQNLSVQQIRGFMTSPAAIQDSFRYVGNGYFLSRYESSAAEELFKLAGRFFEGSVNFQLGDLFSVCTAGDIRVSYEAVTIPQISGATVIGQLLNEKGDIGLYTTSR